MCVYVHACMRVNNLYIKYDVLYIIIAATDLYINDNQFQFCLVAQNQWIRENLFDAHGNYLYCVACIVNNLGVYTERLSRQRQIKVRLCQEPIVVMTKKEVVEKKLVSFVLHPDVDESVTEGVNWWETLDDGDDVDVIFPHEQHGLTGKPSNHSKPATKDAFLRFVDANSHPNGRQAGSYSAQFYFIPKFTRIEPPSAGEKDFEKKARSSVVWVFNRAQEEAGESTCSGFAARQWLKEYRAKVALHPHKSDYCDTCKYYKEDTSRQQAILKRLSQSGSATEKDLRDVQAKIDANEDTLRTHKEEATAAREYYSEMTQKCSDGWKEISQLSQERSPSPEVVSQLTVAQHKFTLVLSADYQQSKLIPHWGRTEQAGSTYYLQKVSHDIFGLVDHRDSDRNFITIFDERIGPKNTDHTISFLSKYLEKVAAEIPWMRRVCIFLDNAGNTNKNRFLFSWGMEMVKNLKLDYIRFCFLVAGHTKFAPDRVFALIANAYNREDVFTAAELQEVCGKFSTATIEDGSNILGWRSTLASKYSDLPGVRKMHDFLIIRSNEKVLMKIRASCHTGNLIESPLSAVDLSISCVPSDCYSDHPRPLSSDKLAHMLQMYNRYVPPDRWPSYLISASQSNPRPIVTSNPGPSRNVQESSSSEHSIPPAKKIKKCSTPGCDGSGHRNKLRWNEGHTTKAGCPRVRR